MHTWGSGNHSWHRVQGARTQASRTLSGSAGDNGPHLCFGATADGF